MKNCLEKQTPHPLLDRVDVNAWHTVYNRFLGSRDADYPAQNDFVDFISAQIRVAAATALAQHAQAPPLQDIEVEVVENEALDELEYDEDDESGDDDDEDGDDEDHEGDEFAYFGDLDAAGRKHGWGIEMSYHDSDTTASKCKDKCWDRARLPDMSDEVIVTDKVHGQRYQPLLLCLKWLASARDNDSTFDSTHLMKALPAVQVIGEAATQSADDDQGAEPTPKRGASTRGSERPSYRRITLATQLLLAGASVPSASSPVVPIVAPAAGVIAAPVPAPCKCLQQVYVGRFVDGERQEGMLLFPDGSVLFKAEDGDDFAYFHPDGRTTVSLAASAAAADKEDEDEDEDDEDAAVSVVIDKNAAGQVTFAGTGSQGVKQGPGALASGDGAVFMGTWEQGVFSCDDGTWMLPSGNVRTKVSALALLAAPTGPDTTSLPFTIASYRGQWRQGNAVHARTEILRYDAPATSPAADVAVITVDSARIRQDPGTATEISSTPLQRDAWETHWVAVDRSAVNDTRVAPGAVTRPVDAEEPQAKRQRTDASAAENTSLISDVDAGEGLFAVEDIPQGTLLAFYNGTRPPTAEVDRRHWDLNGNSMTLIDGMRYCIDIPAPYDQTSAYVGSLGHKCNHDFHRERVNSAFGLINHPRFCDIKCIFASRDIARGEEVRIDYGYNRSRGGPAWFREGIAQRRAQVLKEVNAALPADQQRKSLKKEEWERLIGEPPSPHDDHVVHALDDFDVRLLPEHVALVVMACAVGARMIGGGKQ